MKANYIYCKSFLLRQENFFKKCQDGIIEITGIMKHTSGLDPYNIDRDYWINAILNIGGAPQHLYLLSNQPIKENDYFINMDFKDEFKILKLRNGVLPIEANNSYKIEATTDRWIGLPFICAEDVQWYMNNKEEISGIKIWADKNNKIYSLQKDNSVIIFKEKHSEYNKAIDDCIKIIESSGIYESDHHQIAFPIVSQIRNLKKK